MSLVDEQIKNELGRFSSKYGPAAIIPAVVTAINADDTIAIEFSDESTVDDARMKSVVADGNKVLLIPKVGSIVLVGAIENSSEYVVLSVHEVTEFKTKIDDVTYSMNATGFLLQKENDTLKSALIDLIEGVEPIIVIEGRNPNRVKLQSAKNKVNNLLR